MKRLFKVCTKDGHKAIEDKYFEKKPEAKAFRDQLNNGGDQYKVSRGPDHWRA